MTFTSDRPAPPEPPTRRTRVAGAAASAAAAVGLGAWVAVSAFRPFTPVMPQLGLDASWVAAMGEAADKGLRWGVDVAFTYGPASPLVTGYFNGAYLSVTLPLLLAICLLFGAGTVLLAGRRPPALAGAVVTVGIVAAFSIGHPDSVFLALPLLPFLLLLSRDRPGAAARAVTAAMALAAGMIGLAKMSFPLAALPLFLLGDGAALLRRRLPILTVPCVLGFLFADGLYGQSPADLPAFLRQQGEVVAGYSEAMAMDGSRRELVVFLAACGSMVALTCAVEWAVKLPRTGSRLAVPLGLAWVLLVLFKAGFVRQDGHTLIAWDGAALAAAVVASARFGPVRPRLMALVCVAAVAATASVGLSLAGPLAGVASPGAVAAATGWRTFVLGPAAQFAAAVDLARDPSAFANARRADKAETWRDLAASAPLPAFSGGVDVIPSQQSRVIAAGLDYRPRPSFQEYSTYTPALLAANRAFLAGPNAPRWILFGPENRFAAMGLDHRYPNLTEGALWLDLLRLYRPERHIGELLALRRRDVPAPLVLGEPRRSDVGFGDMVPVESVSDGPSPRAVFATVDVRPTLLGRLAAFLYRPPPLAVTVRFADGQERPYQFLSGIGISGFVLSPLVDNATEFEALADGTPAPPDRTVTGFSIDTSPRLRALVSPRITVTLRPVSGGEPLVRAAPTSAWASLAAAEGLGPSVSDIGTVPPSILNVPVAGLSHVDLGFGLALADDAPPGVSSLCFAIHPADGTARTLWRRCLDRGRDADREVQILSVALPPGTAEIALSTNCQSSCDEGLKGYWAPPP